MPRRDPERLRRLRAVVHHLVLRDALEHGYQARLAQHFRLSRQRVHQVVIEERELQAATSRLATRQMATNGLSHLYVSPERPAESDQVRTSP